MNLHPPLSVLRDLLLDNQMHETMRWPFEQELTEATEGPDIPVPSSVFSVAFCSKKTGV